MPAPRRAASLLAIAMAAPACDRGPEPPPPDVLLVTMDALRADHLGFAGYARDTSPTLDALAARGVVLGEVVPSGCSTKASLTSLLTGLDFRNHHVIEHGAVLPAPFETLAERFRDAGYRTGAFVATPHLTATMGYDQGFERFEDFMGDGERDGLPYVEAERVAERARRFLTTDDERPSFAYVHFEEPHPPWLAASPWGSGDGAPARFFGRGCTYLPHASEREALDPAARAELVARYDGAIRHVDAALAGLLDALAASGRAERTVVAVATDHGLELGERYSATHGFNPFDEVLRGFLVIAGPGDALAGRAAPAVQARLFDVGATLLARAGIDTPWHADGVDLLGDPTVVPTLAFATCYSGEVVRTRTHKLVRFTAAFRRQLAERGVELEIDEHVLYDLVADPGETRDVKAELPDVYAHLAAELERYRRDVDRPLPPELRAAPSPAAAEATERLRMLGYVE